LVEPRNVQQVWLLRSGDLNRELIALDFNDGLTTSLEKFGRYSKTSIAVSTNVPSATARLIARLVRFQCERVHSASRTVPASSWKRAWRFLVFAERSSWPRPEEFIDLAYHVEGTTDFRTAALHLLMRATGTEVAVLTEVYEAANSQSLVAIDTATVDRGRGVFLREPALAPLRAGLATERAASESRFFTPAAWRRTAVFREVLHPIGVQSVLLAGLVRPAHRAPRLLCLLRDGAGFSDREEDRLSSLIQILSIADAAVSEAARTEYPPALTPCLTRGLTTRQAEICGLLQHGYTNREIAAVYAISAYTVRNHLVRIFERFDVSNRTELATALAGGARMPQCSEARVEVGAHGWSR
jgi:DNA-binding CsgD family transcriptional regulator